MTKSKFSSIYFGATNQGMVRTNNEDTYICQQIWDNNHFLCAAIDGLGGYEGGEIAAELARTTIIKHLEDSASKKVGEILKSSLIAANNEIIRQHKALPNVSQMGCVASVGIIDLSQGNISIAHVGDSRIYQFVNGELIKLTHDHSLVGYREENGELSEEDAMNHPQRNVIDKFLGEQPLNFDSESYIEVSIWPITGNTQYLFCSDGLTDLITCSQISKILSSELSVKEKVNSLISSANEAGGNDNITVILMDIKEYGCSNTIMRHKMEREVEEPKNNKPQFRHTSFTYGVILGLILGAIGMYVFQRIFYDSNVLDNSGKRWVDSQENIKLRHRIAVMEDSIAKLTVIYKIDPTDSIGESNIDIHSLN